MGPGVEVQTFERSGILGLRWFFRIVDTSNWETLVVSQAYKTCRQRNETGQRLARLMGAAFVKERRKGK